MSENVMGSIVDGVWEWRRNDVTRQIEYPDGTTVPYTDAENAAADKRAEVADYANRRAAKQAIRDALNDINAQIDKAQSVIDATSATINASPAPYIKDLARALKRSLQAVKDLARLI